MENEFIKDPTKLPDTYTTKKIRIGFSMQPNDIKVYRIIPHADVTNNNRRLWRAIYKMYEMYERPFSRLEREGFKFTLRKKDFFWFDVIFRQKDGKKSIEFYVATSEFQAEKLKRRIENKISVTFREASIDDLQIPEENTVVQELRYIHHDIFSLNTNNAEVKTPIGNLMQVVDDLQFDGDIARLSICNDAENRGKWVKNTQWTYEKIKRGKVPHRATVNGKLIFGYIKVFIASVINEFNSLITDILQGFSNVFMTSKQRYEKEKLVVKGHTLEDEIGTSKVSKEKGRQPVFRSHIRVLSHSENRLTRDTMAETIALSMQDLSETNELSGVRVNKKAKKKRILQEVNTLQLSTVTKNDPNVNLVSTDEMSKLALMMPNKELQRMYADALDVKQRTEVEIPAVMRNEDGIYLGKAQKKDEKIDIYLPLKNPDTFYRAYAFTGSQGAGKDTSIINFVVEANLKHGISFVIPDVVVEEDRGMADLIRDSLPPDRIIDLNMNDQNYIPPLDLTEVIASLGRNGPSRFADEMIDFMQLEGMNRSEKYLTDAAKASGGSLFNIRRIIEDENFRIETAERLLKEGNIRLSKDLSRWGDDNKTVLTKCEPILSRLHRFFGNERLYDVFAQPPLPELDIRKWMSEGKVIIFRVPNGRGLGGHASKTLVHWITLKVFMTRMLMSKEEQKNGCFMIFNEPEQFQSEGLTQLMGRIGTEGRKERLGSIYAFHHWNKLSPSLQENLQGGGVQQFLFMNDHTKTFDLSKHRFEDTIPIEEAYRLPKHHSIVSVRGEDGMVPAFICHMAPPPEAKYDNSFLTLRHARMYGRSWEELQKTV